MPKLKTHKATAKRIKITKSKKYIERSCSQDHFNARECGKDKRAKRSDKIVNSRNLSEIKKSLPYS